MIATGCPNCHDLKIEKMFTSISCTTHGCENYHRDWEQRALSNHGDYVVLCFCEGCIHCNGEQDFLGKFRHKNVTYDVYYSYWDNDMEHYHFMLLIYGNSKEESKHCELAHIDKHRSIMEKDYSDVLMGYNLFHDKLWSRTLEERE